MNSNIEKQIVDVLSYAIITKALPMPNPPFRAFKNYLHHTKQFQLKCILLENKYLYNSFLSKAKLLSTQGVN